MKKLLSLIMSILVVYSMVPSVSASNMDEAMNAANSLYELGLFQGAGTDENGNPNFDLERAPTRNESVTMLVRLLGMEKEATSKNWDIPFSDVADWAKPYVGYAYSTGLVNGTSATTFGGSNIISATEYITLVLRALGYESGTDFQWDKAWELSDKIGMTNGQYNMNTNSDFTRGDIAKISYDALKCISKNANISLIQYLYNCSVVNTCNTLSKLISQYGKIAYYNEYTVLPKFENINIYIQSEKYIDSPFYETYMYRYLFTTEHEATEMLSRYNDLLSRNGFSVQDGKSNTGVEYIVTAPSSHQQFTIGLDELHHKKGDEWKIYWGVSIVIPIEYVTVNSESFDKHFYLSQTRVTVNRLGTTTVSAIVSSNNNIEVRWRTDNDKIVMIGNTDIVDRGTYTEVTVSIGGLQSGVATIYADLFENGEEYGSACCLVTVPIDTQKSPVKLMNITSKTNSVGGTTWTFDVVNQGSKTMKYISVYWRCYNAVGDPLYDTISHDDRFSCRITGPLDPGSKLERIYNTRPFYNYDYANKIGFIEIVIEYMDGSMEVVNPTNYYDYWDLE